MEEAIMYAVAVIAVCEIIRLMLAVDEFLRPANRVNNGVRVETKKEYLKEIKVNDSEPVEVLKKMAGGLKDGG